MKLNSTILLLIAMIVLGIYIMPGILATFSNPHSVEAKEPAKLACLKCHEYIGSQFGLSNESSRVFQKHANASNNTNYTTFIKHGYHYNKSEGRIYTLENASTWDLGAGADPANYIYWEPSLSWWIDNRTGTMKFATVRLENNGLQGIQLEEICLFCHSADIFSVSTHTSMTVTGCTDIKCHGNSSGIGYGKEFYSIGMTGYNLSNNNVHAEWFKGMGNASRQYNYTVHENSPVTPDYLTCIGCHTYVQVNLNVTKAGIYIHDNISTPKMRYP